MADGKIVIDIIMDDGSIKQGIASIDGINGASEKAGMSLKNMVGAGLLVKGVSAAMGVLKNSVGSAVERFDTLQKFPKVMESLGFNTDQSAKASKRLSDGIDGLPTTLQEVVANTQRMTAITGDLDKSTDATIAMNNAFLASGASTDAASRGMDQYMKMVSTGKVELDGWTTLQETMPLALQKTAEAMGFVGKTAQNDLYSALKNGTVTFDQFQDKLIELGTGTGQLADLAKKNSLGIGTSFKNLQSAITKGLGNVLTKFDEITQKLTGKNIAQNFDSLKVVINATFKGIVSAMDLIIPAVEMLGSVFAKPIEVIKSFGNVVGQVMKYVISNFTNFDSHIKMTMQIKEILPQSVFDGLNNFLRTVNQAIAVIKYAVTNFTNFKAHLDMMGEIQEFMPESAFNALNQGLITVNRFIAGIKGIFGVLTGATRSYSDFAAAIGEDESETWMQPYFNFANKIKEFGSDIAETVGSMFSGIGSTISNSIGSPMDFIKDRISDTTNTIKTVISTLSPAFSTVFNGIKGFIGNFVGSFSGAATGVGNNIGQIISFLGMFSGPLGMVSFLFKNFGNEIGNLFTSVANQLGPLLSNLGSTLGEIAGAVIPMITQAIAAFMPVIGQVISTVINIISSVLPVVISLINQLLPVIQQIISVVMQLWAALMPIIANLISSLLPVIQNIIKAVMNIVTAVAPAVIAIIQTIITIIQALLPVITSIINVVVKVVSTVITYVGMIITVIANVIAVIMSIVSPIISFIAGVISAIFAVITPIIAFISGVFDTIVNVITGYWQMVFNVTSSIWNSVGSIVSGLSAIVSRVFNTISSTISRIMNGVGKTISGIFQGIQNSWTGLTGFVSGVFDGIGSAVETLVNQVKGFVNGVIGGVNAAIGLINKIPGVNIGKIPELRYGTKRWQGGFAMMNEGGRGEIVNLPNGAQVIPHDISAMYAKQAAKETSQTMKGFKMPSITAEVALGIGQRMSTGSNNVSNYYTTNNNQDNSDNGNQTTIFEATIEMEGKTIGKGVAKYVNPEINRINKRTARVRGDLI